MTLQITRGTHLNNSVISINCPTTGPPSLESFLHYILTQWSGASIRYRGSVGHRVLVVVRHSVNDSCVIQNRIFDKTNQHTYQHPFLFSSNYIL